MKTELKQREGDGRWVLWGWMPDPTLNRDEWIVKEMPFPWRWVAIAVYDRLIEIIT